MIPLLLMAALSLNRSCDSVEWLCFEQLSADSICNTAQDRVSGVLVWYCAGDERRSNWPRSPSDELVRPSGRISVYELDRVGLSESERRLVEIVGPPSRLASPGTWLHAYVESHTPPTACKRELWFELRRGNEDPWLENSVVCSQGQRTRALEYVEARLRGFGACGAVVGPVPYGETKPVSGALLAGVEKGMALSSVLDLLGPPDLVWPRWPASFTLLWPLEKGAGHRIAVDFGRTRLVAGVRELAGPDDSPEQEAMPADERKEAVP